MIIFSYFHFPKFDSKLALVFVWITTAFIHTAVSQSVIPEPPVHKLNVYRNSESQTLFWPKALPVFVWLSSSPDQTSQKHLLNRGQKDSSEGREELETTQINLELSGNQFVRWVNYQTRDTILLKFQADGMPPNSDILYSGSKEIRLDKQRFFGPKLKVEFKATDVHSGVEDIFISVNGAEFTPYRTSYNFTQEKEYLIAWYALDRVGNAETVQSQTFTVDLSPPNSRHSLVGIHQGDILSHSATIQLTSEDALSGLNTTHYLFDNAEQETDFKGEIAVSTLGEGVHILKYRSTDKVGNIENYNEYQFYLDKTAPKTLISIEGDHHQSEKVFVSPRSLFRISATDNKSGVKTTHYQISGKKTQTYSGGTFSLPSKPDNYTLSYWSEDNVGNMEFKNSKKLVLDAVPPKASHLFEGTSFSQRGITWIPSATQVLFHATDEASGVQSIMYSIEGDVQQAIYQSPLNFTNEGRYKISYTASDKVNNMGSLEFLLLAVDNTAPEIIINFSNAKIGSTTAVDGSVLDTFPMGTQLYLAATDASSGADGIWITVNEEKEQTYSSALTFSDEGEYNVFLRALDRVGNQRLITLSFIISK